MPIFDEPVSSIEEALLPSTYLGSPDIMEIDTSMPVNFRGGNIYGDPIPSKNGLTYAQISQIAEDRSRGRRDANMPFQSIPTSELLENKRFPLYERGVDLENVNALHQGWATQLANGFVKMGVTAAGTFAQSFATLPNTIAAIQSGELKDLSGDENSAEAKIGKWVETFEDSFPNFMTRYEKDHPFTAAIPFFAGSANFWGNSIIKNLGFTVGAIGGALAQDAIIGAVTGGIGAAPLIGGQIGKASLYLNKILTGANNIDNTLAIATQAGLSGNKLFALQSLQEIAQGVRITDKLKYGLALYGSARTEAAIEAREGYEKVKEQLLEQARIDNLGEEATPEQLQEIEEYATNAMNTGFGINMALLTVSNAIQFDNLLKSFTQSTKGLQGSAIKELEEFKRIGLKEGSLDEFEKKTATSFLGKVWEGVKPKVANIFTEGIYEEGGQYAAERGTYDYYTRKYKNLNNPQNRDNWNSLNETIDSTTKGLSDQFSTNEGILNMLIGGISAAITGGVLGKIDSVQRRGKDARLQSSVNILNRFGLTGILQNKYGDTLTSVGIAKDIEDAISSKNIFKFKNLQHDSFFNFVYSRIPSDMHDVTIEQLQMLKDLKKEEFEEMFNIDFNSSNKSTVQEYVSLLIDKANEIKSSTDSINKTFTNPFTPSLNPKTDEEAIETRNYDTFEEWKQEIAYYSSIAPDRNERLNSINASLFAVNPLLSNELVASVTNKDSLKELSLQYEERANQLNKSITEFTSPQDRKRTRDEIKVLRNHSERISLSLNNKQFDLKDFNSLLNFELNGRETKIPVIPIEKSAEIFEYGDAINKINKQKEDVATILSNLITKEGFEKYFEQAETLADKPLPKEEGLLEEEIKEPSFKNKNGELEPIELNREYQIPKLRQTKKVKQLADDRWQITSPDGTIQYAKTKEDATKIASQLTQENNELLKVRVIAINSDGSVKVEDSSGNIQNISLDRLEGYERIETELERLQKNADQLSKEQDEIENNSGNTSTPDTSNITIEDEEGAKKDAPIFYISSITESEDWKDPTQSSPHIQRSREFLNNVKRFKNKDKLRAILITAKQTPSLGVEGIVQMSYALPLTTELKDIPNIFDVNKGWVANVYVIQEGNKQFFVDKEGNKLTEVGKPADINSVVFQTMPTTEFTTTNNKGEVIIRGRANQRDELEAYSKAWGEYREQLFKSAGTFPTFKFNISRGIPIELNDGKERNFVGDVLIDEKLISKHKGLIVIPTTNTISHNGQILKFPNGVPVLQYGDTLQFLQNRKFNNEEASTLYQVINALAKDTIQQSENNIPIRLNREYTSFLSGMLFWKKGPTIHGNQIRIDVSTMDLQLGDKRWPLTEISDREKEITEYLSEVFSSVNNDGITKNFDESFTEFYLEDNILKQREWKNYQSFLLLKTFPDGASRPLSLTPLSTSVAKPTKETPYSYKQKYSTLEGIELPVQEIKKPSPKPTPTVPSGTIGDIILDGVSDNVHNSTKGPVLFTGTIKGEDISISVTPNDTTKLIAEDEKLVNNVIVPFLKQIDRFDSTEKSNNILVQSYFSNKILLEIIKERNKTQKEKEEPSIPPPTIEDAPQKPSKYDPKNTTGPSDNYRQIGEDGDERITEGDLVIFKEWHSQNVPNIPYEALENIISINNDEKAWGVFEDGVAKFFKKGLKGTEYHEIFEGIWGGFLSPQERDVILQEFNANKGSFIDRQTGKRIDYFDASPKQAKERIADDFADFRIGKLPAKSLSERLLRFFRAILNFFKSFVQSPSKREELFKAINKGKFKNYILSPGIENNPPEYRRIEGLTEKQTKEFIEDMTARAAGILFNEGEKKLLFNSSAITSNEMFERIEEKYLSEGKKQALGDVAWEELKQRTRESLLTIGINFNEEDVLDINSENSSNRNYAAEAFSTDWKKNSTGAIKFSLATLLETQARNQEGSLSLELPPYKTTDIKGYKLLNFSRAFATLLDKLSNSTHVSTMVDKILALAEQDSNYVRQFTRLGGMLSTKSIDFSEFNNDDWRYFIQFAQTFTKQKPQALIQYKTGAEVYTAPADLFGVINQTKRDWIENMKALSKNKESLIKYNKSERTYKIASLTEIPIKTIQNKIDFLNSIGIEFPLEVYKKLRKDKKDEIQMFDKAVSAIKTYASEKNIISVTGNTLTIDGQLTILAKLLVQTTNPVQDNTHNNVEDKRVNNYEENNVSSLFENIFNSVQTLDELYLNDNWPQVKDVFSKNSVILRKGGIYFDEEGNRIKSIKTKYIDGTKELTRNKGLKSTSLSLGERFTQEINQNLNGDYYVLIPADGSTEWMMSLGNNITFKDVEENKAQNKIHTIFRRYLSDDIALALDNRNQLKNVGERAKELRFFKDILFKKELDGINSLIVKEASQEQIEEYINNNIGNINSSIDEFIRNINKETKNILIETRQIQKYGENEFSYFGLDDNFSKNENIDKFSLSETSVDNLISFLNSNYIINNIELHKILFGDPYQFAIKNGKLEETKRIKSFLSPRRTTFDSPEYNTFLNEYENYAGITELKEGDPGFHNYKPYTNTLTIQDVKIVGSLSSLIKNYANTNEADSFSWLMDNTYKEIKLKNGQWGDEAETFHQWQMAYTRQRAPWYTYSNEKLRAQDEKLISKPSPKHTIEVLKPIVSGNKYGESKTDIVLDKFSQMPIYYSMVEGTNLAKIYERMFKEGKGYAIVESGRKVGVESTYSLYNKDGSLNEEAFNNNIKVSWRSYGIQVETSSDTNVKSQTRGSQLTKLSSMDLFNNGIPSSLEAEKEYKRNIDILNKMHENAYNELLIKWGVEDLGDTFILKDGRAVSETLMSEMLRRKMSDNAKDTIQLDENDQFRIPFEASPSYIQIRDIIYSMVHKALISPTMSGGPHVQVPSTLFESGNRKLAIKTEDGWKHISKEEYESLTEEEKAKTVITDNILKFYTRESPYCEILLPHWFKEKFNKKKLPTDESILKYLNSTKEGRSILRGVGFRIPTQALSSAEVFKVKGFLPQYMGSTVVVPSEITTKAGSDFDIDKLNMYLKAIYIDSNDDIKLVRYKGTEENTKEFFSKNYNDTIYKRINEIHNFDEFRGKLWEIFRKFESLEEFYIEDFYSLLSDEEQEFYEFHQYVFQQIINQAADESINPSEYLRNQINDLDIERDQLTKKLFNEILKTSYIKDMYKKSLENEYYDSLEKLLTLPEQFDKLISPLGDVGLREQSIILDSLRGYDESSIKNKIINRNFMTSLRQAFSMAKNWVGIAAVNITNLSLKQKSKVFIDPQRFFNVPLIDQKFLGDGNILLPHNIVDVNGSLYTSLSSTLTYDKKELISQRLSGYGTSIVDVANDPYILKIIQSPLIIGTFMFLENIGVGNLTGIFLNQPIISEYMSLLDSIQAKNLFNQQNINAIKQRFPTTNELIDETYISIDLGNLERNIKDYYKKVELSDSRNSEQQKILDEFLKYAKMAEYNFKFTQATNYDTTKFRSAESLSRKQWKTTRAEDTNIISSVNNILSSTFIGEQKKFIDNSVEAIGAIFKLDDRKLRDISDSVLRSYGENDYLSQDKYDVIANRIKMALLDYIIQTKTHINTRIKELLIDEATSVANRLEQAKKEYPQIEILKHLSPISGNRKEGATSIKLDIVVKDVDDENMYMGMMRELRDVNDEYTNRLYQDIISLAILQGSAFSSISLRNIIPVEDYSLYITETINTLSINFPEFQAFTEGMFQRNNFRDDDVMPVFQPKFFLSQEMPVAEQLTSFGDVYADIYQYYSVLFPNIKPLNIKSSERKVLFLSEKYNSYDLRNEYIKVPRVVEDNKTGEKIDMQTGLTITKMDYAKRKAKGDPSLNNWFGYKKVFLPNGIPLTSINGRGDIVHVYKLINLEGDSIRAIEMYDTFQPSVIDNGTIKTNEIPDSILIEYFSRPEEILPAKITIQPPSPAENIVPLQEDKERIKKEYPALINANGKELLTSVLQEFANIEENTLIPSVKNEDYAATIEKLYGEAAAEYVAELDTEFYKEMGEFAKKNPTFFNSFVDAFLNAEESEGLNIFEYAQLLLDENVKLIDRAQLNLFDTDLNTNDFKCNQ